MSDKVIPPEPPHLCSYPHSAAIGTIFLCGTCRTWTIRKQRVGWWQKVWHPDLYYTGYWLPVHWYHKNTWKRIYSFCQI